MPYVAKEWVEHQRKRWLRHDAWRFAKPNERPEVKFDPNQPRVPAGSPEGGQWTREAPGSGFFQAARRVSAAIEAECAMMHRQDLFICRAVQSRACYAQAYLRYSNCLSGRPIPPLNF